MLYNRLKKHGIYILIGFLSCVSDDLYASISPAGYGEYPPMSTHESIDFSKYDNTSKLHNVYLALWYSSPFFAKMIGVNNNNFIEDATNAVSDSLYVSSSDQMVEKYEPLSSPRKFNGSINLGYKIGGVRAEMEVLLFGSRDRDDLDGNGTLALVRNDNIFTQKYVSMVSMVRKDNVGTVINDPPTAYKLSNNAGGLLNIPYDSVVFSDGDNEIKYIDSVAQKAQDTPADFTYSASASSNVRQQIQTSISSEAVTRLLKGSNARFGFKVPTDGVRVYGVFVNMLYDIMKEGLGPVSPYVGLGTGLVRLIVFGGAKNTMGYQFHAGLSYAMTKEISVKLGYVLFATFPTNIVNIQPIAEIPEFNGGEAQGGTVTVDLLNDNGLLNSQARMRGYYMRYLSANRNVASNTATLKHFQYITQSFGIGASVSFGS